MTEKKISQYNKKELLEFLEKSFTDVSLDDSTYRSKANMWYEYYHGEQWTSEEVQALEDRGQAVTTYNEIKPAIDSVIGSERQNRPKISMSGRTLDDFAIAEAKTSLYQYIEYISRTDDQIDLMEQDALVTGRGWMQVYPDVDSKNDKVDIKHFWVDYRDMYLDPLSKKEDMSDARYLHHAVYTDIDIVEAIYPKFTGLDLPSKYGFDSSSDDYIWYNEDRTRVRLITSWFVDEKGNVKTATWVRGQILYVNNEPFTICNRFPYVHYTINTDLNNKPYGLVKHMISAQDEVNKRHSKALHLLNSSSVLAEEDAFVDWNEAMVTLAKPNGVTKLTDGALAQGKVQLNSNVQLASEQLRIMDVARERIYASAGLNSTFAGQGSQYESAKKANISLAQAQNSMVKLLNKLRIARWELAKITMSLVPDFYTDARLIRILDPQSEFPFMPINDIKRNQDGSPMLNSQGQVISYNKVTDDDVDIMIEDAPRGLSDSDETFQQLLQLQASTSRPIPIEMLIRYSPLKHKNELSKEIEQFYNNEQQLQQAMQQIEAMQQQMKQQESEKAQLLNQLTQVQISAAVDKEVNKQTAGLSMLKGL